MATFKCTDGNNVEILFGEMSEKMKEHFGITGKKKDADEFTCERCGDCCVWCHIPVHPAFAADPRVPEWLEARGAELSYEKATIDGFPIILPFLTFKLPCQFLIHTGFDGAPAAGALHNTKKPLVCKQYRCDRDPILMHMKNKKKENQEHEF